MPIPIGTITNVLAVILGGALGLILHKQIPERIKKIIFLAIGLFTFMVGILMIQKTEDPLLIIASLIIGGIIGELLCLEDRLQGASEYLKNKIKIQDSRFTEGMVTAFLIFCIGAMTIVGSINEGLNADPSLLLLKSVMDGFVSIGLATSFGAGVIFSVIPLFLFQYGITLLAFFFSDIFSGLIIGQLTATGGLLIFGIGINILEIKKLKLINLLPALIIIVVLTLLKEILIH